MILIINNQSSILINDISHTSSVMCLITMKVLSPSSQSFPYITYIHATLCLVVLKDISSSIKTSVFFCIPSSVLNVKCITSNDALCERCPTSKHSVSYDGACTNPQIAMMCSIKLILKACDDSIVQ